MCRRGYPPCFSRSKAGQLSNQNLAEGKQALSEPLHNFIAHQNAVLLNPTNLREHFLLHGMGHRFTRRLQSEHWMEMRLDTENQNPKRGGMAWMVTV